MKKTFLAALLAAVSFNTCAFANEEAKNEVADVEVEAVEVAAESSETSEENAN